VNPAYNAAGIVMTYQTVKELSPLEAGYLAGLIDGEGTITLSRRNLNKHRALVVTVSSTELSILKFVQEITGVGKITNKRITKAPTNCRIDPILGQPGAFAMKTCN
jgi:hypothetical protein